jgi:hypothetical protein
LDKQRYSTMPQTELGYLDLDLKQFDSRTLFYWTWEIKNSNNNSNHINNIGKQSSLNTLSIKINDSEQEWYFYIAFKKGAIRGTCRRKKKIRINFM